MGKRYAFLAFIVITAAGCGGSSSTFKPANFGGLLVFQNGGTLITMNQDGTNQREAGDDFFVASMSESKRIATSNFSGSQEDIVALNANGSNQRTLTNTAQDDFRPAISPDGTKIAFISERDGNREIYVMDAHGSNETRLTNDPAEDYFPSFSADGTKIVFPSKRDGNEEIYVMDANGANQTRLTNNGAIDTTPAFSPNGAQILFCSQRDGNYEIYKADANGANPTRITTTPGEDEVHASWNLAGTNIFYYDQVAVRRINPDGTGRIDLFAGGSKTCTWVYP